MIEDTSQVAPPRRTHPVFWALWGFDVLVAAVVVVFFFWGLADGSVSSFNIMLWLGMLIGVAVVVGGGWMLYEAGQSVAAYLVLLVLAFPGFMYGLFILAIILLQPDFR